MRVLLGFSLSDSRSESLPELYSLNAVVKRLFGAWRQGCWVLKGKASAKVSCWMLHLKSLRSLVLRR